MHYLISAEELKRSLDQEKKPIIFDCRFDLMQKDYGKKAYQKGHIPGAYFLDFEQDLVGKSSPFGGNHPFLTVVDFQKKMEDFGVCDMDEIVVYDDGDMVGATRFLYQALYSGVNHVRVLDGGLCAWKTMGGSIDETYCFPEKKGALSVIEKKNFIVTQDYVKAHKDKKDTVLIDSRSAARYRGEIEPVYPIAGHIPGAVNYFYGDVLDENGQLKDKEILKKHFEDLGNHQKVILSCGSGVSACVNGIALLELGIEHQLYNGSYSEWIANPDNKVEK